jgi:hypothetical protein
VDIVLTEMKFYGLSYCFANTPTDDLQSGANSFAGSSKYDEENGVCTFSFGAKGVSIVWQTTTISLTKTD